MVSGEKRNNEEEHLMEKITTILLDIEGTTTPVSFVKDTLFPYVKDQLESYVESHWEDNEFKEDRLALKEQAKLDEESKVEGFCPIEEGEKEKESLLKNIFWQMSVDRKTTALKQLQGHIWREGYKNGKLKGSVFSDVVPVLKKWSEENRKIYIFSSGSVEAQKLLFGHLEEGDILNCISGHFDTTIGPKVESSSYADIVKQLQCEKDQILFLTDVVKEAKAARTAGMQTALVIRDGNAPLTDEDKQEFVTISSFHDLVFENSTKRKKISDSFKDQEAGKERDITGIDENSHVNGSEKMDVDSTMTEEDYPERMEDGDNSQNQNEKSEPENKAEHDDIEIDVVNEDKKEGNAVQNTNSDGDSPADISSTNEEDHVQMNSTAAEKVGENECNNSEQSGDNSVTENNDASDPLYIGTERSQDGGISEDRPIECKIVDSSEGKQTCDEANDTEKQHGEEKTEGKNNENSVLPVIDKEKEESGDVEKDSTNDKTDDNGIDSTPDYKIDSKDCSDINSKTGTVEKIAELIEEKEVNGKSAYNESPENGGINDETIALSKVVSEDPKMPDSSVEVNA